MSEEKREYVIGKLEKYAGIIEGISTAAQSFMPQELKAKLFELHGLNSELLERVRNNSFEIAIVGLEKAGKSTFANALIGLDILPAKEERCTYTSSCVKYADQTYAEVEYYTSEEFGERFESNLKTLGAEFDSYEYGRVTLDELQSKIDENNLDANRRNILEDVSDMIRSEFAIMPLLGKSDQHFNEASMKDAEFRNLIQNPDRTDGEYVPKPSFAVKKITVYSDKLEDMRNCIIYDVPGFDSPTAIHMEQTKERMDKADAIILIANASKPSLTGPQLTIFSSAVDSDNIPFNEKVFVFANRADESKDLEYNMGTLKNDLDKYHILRKNDSNRLIPGSAYAALCIAGGREDDQAVANLKANGISDGIEEIKKKLKEYNDVVRIHVIEKRVENLEKMILETADAIKLSCSAVSSGDGSNADMINAFVDVQNKIKEKLVFFESEIRKIVDEKPLTSGLLAALKGKLNTGELLPDEDEISYIKERCTQSTAQFEASLRDFKRAEVREIFSDVTQCVTEDLK
ncbi:MAG: dynamin family protein [Oscillospiraceae bacterium]|nr:dynamin family protein [Oscillospiraceae bacterium]